MNTACSKDNLLLLWRARVLAILGRREEAVSLIQEWLPWDGADSLHRDESLESLRGWAPYEDLVRPRG